MAETWDDAAFVARCREVAQSKNMTFLDVTRAARIGRGFFDDEFQGIRSTRVVAQVATALGVRLNWLLTGEGPLLYLREWRRHRGLSETQVQNRLGWLDGQVSKIESGAVPVPPDLSELARLYACEISDLFAPPPT